MEVHKHPQHVSHRKKWNEYLFEFFMLFLAVFCGFMAENLREHIVEHDREEKFVRRLLSDLREDSAFLQKRIKLLEERQKKQAHFNAIMTDTHKPTDSAVISAFNSLLQSFPSEFTTTTYNQMKASGTLRYIHDDSVTTGLEKYYEILVPKASSDAEDIQKVFITYIFPYIVKHFRFQDLNFDRVTNYVLLSRTAESDQELINLMGGYAAGCDALLDKQKPALEKAKELILRIKEEYRLE